MDSELKEISGKQSEGAPLPHPDIPMYRVEAGMNPARVLIPLGVLLVAVLTLAIGAVLHANYVRSEARSLLQAENFELSQSAFVKAVREGTPKLMARYLDAGLNPTLRDPEGHNPLHAAIDRGDPKIFEKLLGAAGHLGEEHVFPSGMNEQEPFDQSYKRNCLAETAPTLNYASAKGNVEMLTLLHQQSDIVLGGSTNSWSPLSCAAASNNGATTEWLLTQDIRVDRLEPNGRTALGNAVLNDSRGAVELLLEHGASPISPETFGETSIFDAARAGDEAIVTLLLKYPIDLNHTNYRGEKPWQVAEASNRQELLPLLHPEYLLFAGLVKENPAVVTFALERGARINISDRDGITPLLLALSGGMPNEYRYLLNSENGLSYSAKNTQMPVLANNTVFAKQFDAVRKLARRLDKGESGASRSLLDDDSLFAQLNAPPALLSELDRGHPPLIPSSAASQISEDRSSLIELLVLGGADVNASDVDGNTPLHYATQRGELPLLALLLKKGANYEKTNKDSVSPILHAARLKRPDIVLLFLNSSPPKEIDANLEKVLVRAVETGQNGVVEKLLMDGVNPNLTDAAGRQLVFVALTQENYELAEILMHHGATLELTEKAAQSLYLYARRDYRKRLQEFLEKHATGGENISAEKLERLIQAQALSKDARRHSK